MARNPGLVVRRMQVLHTVWERTVQEAAVPIVVVHMVVAVVHKEAAEAVQAAHMAVAVAAPIVVVHKAVEAVQAVHRVVEAAVPIVVVQKVVEVVQVARMAAVVVDSDLAAVVGLDHKTWIISSCHIGNHFSLTHSRLPHPG